MTEFKKLKQIESALNRANFGMGTASPNDDLFAN